VVLPLAVFAMGNILGAAWRASCRPAAQPSRDLCRGMLASAVAAMALFGWQDDLAIGVALGFVYVFFNAIARPSLMASLTDVPEHVRGTVMGLNVTCSSIGWLGAAALGGWMIATFGFAGFGPLAATVTVIGGGLALIRPR
jgi:predicted MFS family arabinose efflux permease